MVCNNSTYIKTHSNVFALLRTVALVQSNLYSAFGIYVLKIKNKLS